jgi:D-alanyl-D-alanine dipeptidase
MPVEKGEFRKSDLVELIKLDSTIRLDIRYATHNNFTGKAIYPEARAFLQRNAALALVRANAKMKKHGYGIVVYDGYRPWSITKMFWQVSPKSKRIYVANPKKGSKHNRGCAVDVSLYSLTTGSEVNMISNFDDMSERAHTDYKGGTIEQQKLRTLLIAVMQNEGFVVLKNEWWHFDYKEWKQYHILDIPFSEL